MNLILRIVAVGVELLLIAGLIVLVIVWAQGFFKNRTL